VTASGNVKSAFFKEIIGIEFVILVGFAVIELIFYVMCFTSPLNVRQLLITYLPASVWTRFWIWELLAHVVIYGVIGILMFKEYKNQSKKSA